MTSPGFVHLRAASSYSLLEGAVPLARLVDLAVADGQPALALTDRDNLFGALEFSEKAAAAGLQPIMGLNFALQMEDAPGARGGPRTGRMLALARHEAGYKNLMNLSTACFFAAEAEGPPRVTRALLAAHAEGLILLTGGVEGPLGQLLLAGKEGEARALLLALAGLFPRALYVEVQRHGVAAERQIEPLLLKCAYDYELPLVATNSCLFAQAQDFEAHDALRCIAAGHSLADDTRAQLNVNYRFKTQVEMRALFSDLPEAVDTTIEIAQRCAYRPRPSAPILPRFIPSADDAGAAEAALCRRLAQEGLERRLNQLGLAPGLARADYEARLAFELDVIQRMTYDGYFLIVSDFIRWAKAQGIPVGPGRGSGAGSLVAYALDITDLDPLRFGLLFERFLNPERVSMPDFDIDFCQERRGEVIAYVQETYGRDRVAQIITFGSLQARGVLRDVGRVLDMPYGQVDKLTKLVPHNPANPIDLRQAVDSEPRLRQAAEEEPVVKRLLDIALKLEGLYRHASTHAAGIVIADRPLHELVPLYRDPKSDMPVTQFNMKGVEQAGLVKFDFLGLKTLTVLAQTVALLKESGVAVDLKALPLDDTPAYAALARAETVGLFQLESAGMRKAIADIVPDRFEDIIALVALYRPGPMANIPVYGARKHGRERADYLHPKLEPILRETYGIIVYQEQVMQIAQVLAGYSLGEADLLRRAMGKKIRAEMNKQRNRFVSGAAARGVSKAQAEDIFDLLAKFADYGFNKSHAAAYALVAYQTAYLKANYPLEFLAATMTLDAHDTDKLAEMRDEALRLGLRVMPPNINLSQVDFAVRDGSIVYALSALKGLGRGAAEALVRARGNQPFTSVDDFAQRLPPKILNKRMVEVLAMAGAFDQLEPGRARVHASADMILATAQTAQNARSGGQESLFGGASGAQHVACLRSSVEAWSLPQVLQHEFEAVGFYMSGHPLDDYKDALRKAGLPTYAELCTRVQRGDAGGRLAATLLGKQERRTRTGGKIGILTLSDPTGTFEAVCFQEVLLATRDLLESGAPLLLTLDAELQGDEIRLRINAIERLDDMLAKTKRKLSVHLDETIALPALKKHLSSPGSGAVAFYLALEGEGMEAEISLPETYAITPHLIASLKAVPGVRAVRLSE